MENIRVVVRVRPFLSNEKPRRCVTVCGNQIAIGEDRQFAFDTVFDADATADGVSDSIGEPLAAAFVGGYTVSTIAYGQTGAGKTHTMVHLSASMVRRVFNQLESRSGVAKGNGSGHSNADNTNSSENDISESLAGLPSFRLSAVEVYNEHISDLIAVCSGASGPTAQSLPLREDARGGVYIQGLTEVRVADETELLTWIDRCTANRHTASTLANATSSRSHCLLTLTLTLGGAVSRLGLVDLAGSERMKKAYGRRLSLSASLLSAPPAAGGEEEEIPTASLSTGRRGGVSERMREGININSGLLALGNVIVALCERRPHVPYRSSKLTRLLQPMLSGNSKTTMIACVSPAASSFEETLNTLKYADRAKAIHTTPFQVAASYASGEEAERTILWLRSQVETLQRQLQHEQQEHEVTVVYPPTEVPIPTQLSNPTTESATLERVAELENQLKQERQMTQRLQEDLFNAEYAAMMEVEKRKALEQRLARQQPFQHQRHPASSTQSSPEAVRSTQATDDSNDNNINSTLNEEHSVVDGTSVLAKLEAERDALRALKDRTEADSARLRAVATARGDIDTCAGGGGGEMEDNPTNVNSSALLERIRSCEYQIQQLSQQNEEAIRALDNSRRRLESIRDAKSHLEEELQRAESRLEATTMERDRKDAERWRLQSQYQQRLRRAEEEAAEYRRRVQEATALVTARQANADRIQQLQTQLLEMSDELNRQRYAMREEQQRVHKMAASHAQEVNHLQRQMRESAAQMAKLQVQLQRKEREIARVRSGQQQQQARQRTNTPPPKTPTQPLPAEQQEIDAELTALAGLEKELDEVTAERNALRESLDEAQARTGEMSKWRKATKGFAMRLEYLEKELHSESIDDALRQRLLEEKVNVEDKLRQLRALEPMFAQAAQQLTELDESIDSLQEARKYHLRRVRRLQRGGAARTANGMARASDLLRERTAQQRRGRAVV